MPHRQKVNILLVDDQPGKLLSYEVILTPLGENLIRASSAREALAELLKTDVAVILIDVQMPDLDGFELAAMIREHPRFQSTAIIFVSAVYYSKDDTMRGYAIGAVDYVTVPVIPEVLRAKVQVFVDLYRKTRQLERFNNELERRVDDRTAELEAAMKRQAILAREVDHRAKNMLAVVQSIVRLSRANSVGEYALALEGRIGALGRTHALLSESHWEGANLAQIVEDELVPYVTEDSARLTIAGPRIVLEPAAAQSLTLVIHELATNAAKYGSLSSPQGRLSVNFEMQPETLVLLWDESGGPGIAEPKEAGFGSKLISTCMIQLRGSAKFDWAGDGLKFSLTAARGPELEMVDSGIVGNGLNKAPAGRDIGPTALLVEDEPLVAMMIADLLTELHFQVLGPFARTEDAIAAAKKRSVQVAVLDINLAGKLVYPVASYLRASGVPFIFVSGYTADGIDERFTEVPLLQKPVVKEELYQMLKRVTMVTALS